MSHEYEAHESLRRRSLAKRDDSITEGIRQKHLAMKQKGVKEKPFTSSEAAHKAVSKMKALKNKMK